MQINELFMAIKNKFCYSHRELESKLGLTQPQLWNYQKSKRFPAAKVLRRIVDFANQNGFKIEYAEIEPNKVVAPTKKKGITKNVRRLTGSKKQKG